MTRFLYFIDKHEYPLFIAAMVLVMVIESPIIVYILEHK